MKIDEWQGCYPSKWKGMIVEGAIAHPAKFSSRLITRIYEHMLAEGWLKDGDLVIDPFGGVALGALEAMRHGLRWRGVELEAKFSQLGNENIALWNKRFSVMPHWCQDAVLLKGDSRYLLDILQGAADTATALSSPPYSEARIGQESGQEQCGRGDQYGGTEGQLGAMRGDDFQAAISSPPFRQASGGTPEPRGEGAIDDALYQRHAAGNAGADGYGQTDGQLANMGEGDYDGAVSSPPFKGQSADGGWQMLDKYAKDGKLTVKQVAGDPSKSFPSWSEKRDTSYGHSDGQLADDEGDSFWLAARTIVEQVYIALRPGGHAVWVVKGFVKDKAIVDFPGQWRQLCEAVGFVTVHEHHAMLTNHKGASHTLEGGLVEHKTEAKSFFRRNGENKARAAKWWETAKMTNAVRQQYLQRARDIKNAAYDLDRVSHPEREIRPPTENIILAKAQSLAWADAGSPEVEISTSIDYETVFCMEKR